MLKKTDALITLDNVGRHVQGRWLVRGVGFSVLPGEIVTLIGPNGSGKTTTARLALGIDQPSEGRVLRGEDLRVAYVPQKMQIDWTLPLKVSDLMNLTSRLSAVEMDEALSLTGAQNLKLSEVRNLSGGEFQRVLLARALARKPQLLVLDEPVQGVDVAGEVAIYDLITSIRDKFTCGIILISHDLHMVMAATDKVICLNGHVCCQGTPEKVAASAEYRALFGERAASTLAVYQHHHDHAHLADGRVQHKDGTFTDHCHPEDGHHHHDHKGHDHA